MLDRRNAHWFHGLHWGLRRRDTVIDLHLAVQLLSFAFALLAFTRDAFQLLSLLALAFPLHPLALLSLAQFSRVLTFTFAFDLEFAFLALHLALAFLLELQSATALLFSLKVLLC